MKLLGQGRQGKVRWRRRVRNDRWSRRRTGQGIGEFLQAAVLARKIMASQKKEIAEFDQWLASKGHKGGASGSPKQSK